MADSPEEIAKHKKAYIKVGAILFAGTILTVAVARFHILDLGEPGISGLDVFVGLMIATIKASAVALIFMHLNHEKILIYKFLLFTCYFAFGMIALMIYSLLDPINAAF
jgi:caa(3)-type oxidase subunit IV